MPSSKGGKKSDQEILALAKKRLAVAMAATNDSRTDERDDLRFAAGSPDNQWQWPEYAQATRTNGNDQDARPCLTINMLPQHIRQVTNDQRQNQPAGKVIPANDEANSDMAEIFEDLVRFIEYNSDADIAYDTACESQVTIGEGYWRILTKYCDKRSFDQDIIIKRIRNSFSVYLDPTIEDPCGADARWALITEELTKEEYEVQYPESSPISSIEEGSIGDDSSAPWFGEDMIRIAEYFYIETTKRKLNLYKSGETAFDGDKDDDVLRKMDGEPIKSRMSDCDQIKWIKTNGFEIIEQSDWLGSYIPIIRVPGNEFEVDGQLYLSGLVRNAKDAQRMYNYWSSQEAEMLALAPKAPYIGAAGQFDGYEDDWKTANVKNHPYIQYNQVVDDATGMMAPAPQRSQPPMVQSGLIAAKNAAAEDIKKCTGQYNASLGQPSNERSGKAIVARQHEGDVSTYHYISNLSRAVRASTRQLVDLIPKIYDRPGRVAQIIGEDGSHKNITIDTTTNVPVTKVQDSGGNEIKKIYNPSVGKYNVRVTTGPSYTTKRQEALDAMVQLLQGNEQLWGTIGDLVVKNMDWPGAQEISKRLMKTIDPKLLADDDDPALKQAQSQIQQLAQQLDQYHAMLSNAHNSIEAREVAVNEAKVGIERYDAETKRITAVANAARAATQDKAITTPEQIQDVVLGTLRAAQDSGHIPGAVGVVNQQQGPSQPSEAPPQAPPLDPNKMMVENSKQTMQAAEHNKELQMQAVQHAHEADMQANAPVPQGSDQ